MQLSYHCENVTEYEVLKQIYLAVANDKKSILIPTTTMAKVNNFNKFPHILTTANISVGDRNYVMVCLKKSA